MDELYNTGLTVFTDSDGEHDDYLVTMGNLVGSWSLVNAEEIAYILCGGWSNAAQVSFREYATNELKQLCIDYYNEV